MSLASSLGRRSLLEHRPTVKASKFLMRMASSSASQEGTIHSNRLVKEQSPYLLQHAHNPVDWHPWGREAFQLAKKENKPIFLSVGYATCHWCHVMERESFEDQETADIMNKHFVNIKVDREERPDVDRVYMTFVQATTGRGGWPMNVWLTPDLEPMYGGTYYPLKDIFQGGQLAMPAFQTVLRRISSLWKTNEEDLVRKGSEVMAKLGEAVSESVGSEGNEVAIEQGVAALALLSCKESLRQRFDSRLGGFGNAPKFPRPSEIEVLLHAHVWHKGQDEAEEATEALHMAMFSLKKMAAGGMYDHIGGGFHRYSVDEYWHVPHFEKMLYDGPQLASVYLYAFQLSADPLYAQVARGVLDYLRRDMTHPEGGLFSAEDADSLDPADGVKKEGAFYLWTQEEVEAALGGAEKAAVFCRAYGIKREGNCTLSDMSDPHKEFGGKNVPIILSPLQGLAEELGMPESELQAMLAEQRKVLHAVRSARPRPSLDDKVVTAWNGMGISALAVASRALSAESPPCPPLFPIDALPAREYLMAAIAAAQFVRDRLYNDADATLIRSFRNQPSGVPGFADDYVHMVAGLLDLYECGGGLEWLQWAVKLQATMDRLFSDPVKGGYFSTSGADPSIKIRIKDDYDGAEPTASSMAAVNLFRLSALLPSAPEGYSKQAHRVLAAFQERLSDTSMAVPKMCCAAHLMLKEPVRQVIVAGPLSSPQTQTLLDAVHSGFVPDKAVLLLDTADAHSMEFFGTLSPEAVAMVERHFATRPGCGPTVFICQNFTCQSPTQDPSQIMKILKPSGRPAAPKLVPTSLLFS